MQIFVPHDSAAKCATVLDSKRLNKQLVECDQIFRIVTGTSVDSDGTVLGREPRGWKNHPAVIAWRTRPSALYGYALACETERLNRGYASHKSFRNLELLMAHWLTCNSSDATPPWWWGRDDVHASHRAALLYKDPVWYAQFGWKEAPALEYVWPHELNCTRDEGHST